MKFINPDNSKGGVELLLGVLQSNKQNQQRDKASAVQLMQIQSQQRGQDLEHVQEMAKIDSANNAHSINVVMQGKEMDLRLREMNLSGDRLGVQKSDALTNRIMAMNGVDENYNTFYNEISNVRKVQADNVFRSKMLLNQQEEEATKYISQAPPEGMEGDHVLTEKLLDELYVSVSDGVGGGVFSKQMFGQEFMNFFKTGLHDNSGQDEASRTRAATEFAVGQTLVSMLSGVKNKLSPEMRNAINNIQGLKGTEDDINLLLSSFSRDGKRVKFNKKNALSSDANRAGIGNLVSTISGNAGLRQFTIEYKELNDSIKSGREDIERTEAALDERTIQYNLIKSSMNGITEQLISDNRKDRMATLNASAGAVGADQGVLDEDDPDDPSPRMAGTGEIKDEKREAPLPVTEEDVAVQFAQYKKDEAARGIEVPDGDIAGFMEEEQSKREAEWEKTGYKPFGSEDQEAYFKDKFGKEMLDNRVAQQRATEGEAIAKPFKYTSDLYTQTQLTNRQVALIGKVGGFAYIDDQDNLYYKLNDYVENGKDVVGEYIPISEDTFKTSWKEKFNIGGARSDTEFGHFKASAIANRNKKNLELSTSNQLRFMNQGQGQQQEQQDPSGIGEPNVFGQQNVAPDSAFEESMKQIDINAEFLNPLIQEIYGGESGADDNKRYGVANYKKRSDDKQFIKNEDDNFVYGTTSFDPDTTTFGQLQQAQTAGDLHAVGSGQFTRTTLAESMKRLGLTEKSMANKKNQQRVMVDIIMRKRKVVWDYVNGKNVDLDEAVTALAKEWRSIADPKTGKSVSAEFGDIASISADKLRNILKGLRASATSNRLNKRTSGKGAR